MSIDDARVPCPSCGGAGGGPFGRAGSAWDTEEYVCPRCEGAGTVTASQLAATTIPRPGVVKATPGRALPDSLREAAKKRKSGS